MLVGGKNKLASFITDVYGHKQTSFAAPLKQLASECLGREIDKSRDRGFLIALGQKMKGLDYIKEAIPPGTDEWLSFAGFSGKEKLTFWSDILLQSMSFGDKYVISDMRYQVEYDAIRSIGGIVVRIDCPKYICEKRLIERDGGFIPGIWDSVSEKSWQSFKPDIVVENAGKDIEMYLDFSLGYDELRNKSYYDIRQES